MEAGRQLILKDFDRIYGALYDVLNQNYRERKVQTAAGEKLLRICRVALGNAAKHCNVDAAFRCIIIEEERDLEHADPPRLNRCEKQQLTYLSVLRELPGGIGDKLLLELQGFCAKLASFVEHPSLSERDAFLGFNEDTLPSLLVRELLAEQGDPDAAAVRDRCKHTLLDLMPADAIARAKRRRLETLEGAPQPVAAASTAAGQHLGSSLRPTAAPWYPADVLAAWIRPSGSAPKQGCEAD